MDKCPLYAIEGANSGSGDEREKRLDTCAFFEGGGGGGATPTDTTIRRFCNFLQRIGKTGRTRFGAGITHTNGSTVTHFPKYRQYGVRTAHTQFSRCEQFPMLGALGGCSKTLFCRTMRTEKHS